MKMQDENSASQSPARICIDDQDFSTGDELGKLVGDTSFSDVTSDDSSGWMQKIDVTNFQRLTSTASNDAVSNLKDLVSVPDADTGGLLFRAEIKEENPEPGKFLGNWSSAGHFSDSSKVAALPNQAPMSRSSLPFDSNQHLAAPKLSPPTKKSRRDQSARRQDDKSRGCESIDQQISVVSSSSDAARSISHRQFPKPVYSYSCMIALALKNSQTGRLQVAEIYCFMCENYPYFRTAPAGWKNSVRHNLSLNKCFEKIEVEAPGGHGRKCCLWTLNPQKVAKMDQEIKKYREKDPIGVREAYARPEDVDIVEQGLKGMPTKSNAYPSPAFGRSTGADVHISDYHPQKESGLFHPFMAGSRVEARGPYQQGAAKSELALKLLRQAAGYSQGQWRLQLSSSQPVFEAAAAAATWLPPQLENNRSNPTFAGMDYCPLEFSPGRHDGDIEVLSSPPTFSTPIRRSSTIACHSPISHSQPDRQQQRPASLHTFQQHDFGQPSIWLQSSSPSRFDPRPLPVFANQQHRTPDRPLSHGYFGDVMFGGGTSLLVTPTGEPQPQRIFGTRTSLEAAFGATSAHDNSLLLQSVQQPDVFAFHPDPNGQLDGSLHLTCL